MMQLSPAGAGDLRLHEGFVDHWYLDAATPPVGTIGVGFTWASPSFRRWWGMVKSGQKFGPGATITRAQADEALQLIAIEEYGQYVNDFLGREVPQHVFDAATSMVFNCGPGALDWKWAAAMKAGDYAESARLLETTATKAGGKVLKGLVNRRKDEARLMRDGIYISSVGPTMPADTDKSDDDGILIQGERGSAVAAMQGKLLAAGYYNGVIDGIFGINTAKAVRAYQTDNALTVDGIAGPKTLKKMGL